jgi:hypothetical protein
MKYEQEVFKIEMQNFKEDMDALYHGDGSGVLDTCVKTRPWNWLSWFGIRSYSGMRCIYVHTTMGIKAGQMRLPNVEVFNPLGDKKIGEFTVCLATMVKGNPCLWTLAPKFKIRRGDLLVTTY